MKCKMEKCKTYYVKQTKKYGRCNITQECVSESDDCVIENQIAYHNNELLDWVKKLRELEAIK